MGKLAIIALLALLVSSSFSLNISSAENEGQLVFIVDGPRYELTNLTLFVFRDGVQIEGLQRNDVMLPYPFFVPHNNVEGIYEVRAVSQKNEFARLAVNFTLPKEIEEEIAVKKEEQGSTELAIVLAAAGVLVLAYFFASFIKGKSYSK